MPSLRNLRHTNAHGEQSMTADFVLADGRRGSVSVPLRLYDQHGERALQEEADACARQAVAHRYRAPEQDRYRELG